MNQLIKFIIERLSHFGEIPLCNGIASRALHIGGFCFPLCYRCTFILIFFAICMVIFYRRQVRMPYMLIVICMIPMIVDGSIQTFFAVISTNLKRAITGGLFGIGLAAWMTRLFLYLDEDITSKMRSKKSG